MNDEINNELKEKWEGRLKGYASISRSDFLLIGLGELTCQEFILFELLTLVIMDWDSRHRYTYEKFTYDYRQIELYLSWSRTTIDRYFTSLINKGFVEMVDQQTKLYTLHYQKKEGKNDAEK